MIVQPVDITKEAYGAILGIMKKKEIPADYGLRIFVSDSGISCGATNYSLGFDKEIKKKDIIYNIAELKVIIKKIEAVHLAGLRLDYITDNEVAGFSFSRDTNTLQKE